MGHCGGNRLEARIGYTVTNGVAECFGVIGNLQEETIFDLDVDLDSADLREQNRRVMSRLHREGAEPLRQDVKGHKSVENTTDVNTGMFQL